MTTEVRLWVGGLSWSVLWAFCMAASIKLGLFVLLVSAAIGLFWALPKPPPKPEPRPAPRNPVEELLEEALEINRVREEHGDQVADALAERLQQQRTLEVMS